MGANAQTSVPTFTAGEVLTAANMNISARTGIPVFADATARNAAFGGTGEKTLAEGQFAYLEDSNTTQYYDGAAWQPVGTTPGFVCVKAETSFSGVSSINVDNVFSATYTNYLLNVIYDGSGTADLTMRMRVGGVDTSTSTYNRQGIDANGATLTSFRTTSSSFTIGASSTNGPSTSQVNFFMPFVVDQTTIQVYNFRSVSNGYIFFEAAQQTGATSFDGFSLISASGTITGTYSVYGYSKTV